MINSALIYELAILKQYVEPLLKSDPPDLPRYGSKRLLKFTSLLSATGERRSTDQFDLK